MIAVCTERGSAASLFADVVEQVDWDYDRERVDIDELATLADQNGVDLIIPTTDLDAAILPNAAEEGRLPPVAGSPSAVAVDCLDKWRTAGAARSSGLPFATSWLPGEAAPLPAGAGVVVKPRRGGLSAGIRYDVVGGESLTPIAGTMLQERLAGPEITVTCYVTRTGRWVGCLAFERELRAGMTWFGHTAEWASAAVEPVARAWVEHLGVRGSCNLQGKVGPDGFIPFEINCRVSGSARARAAFGFEDVRWLVDEVGNVNLSWPHRAHLSWPHLGLGRWLEVAA
jgi:carbamoyl-phosphate synthase large subunit